MKSKNPFELLRVQGVRGSVATKFNTTTIFSMGNSATLQIRTALVDQDAWAFGFYLKAGEVIRQMLPGEGSGWFNTEKDAMLYALGHVKYGSVELSQDMTYAIDVAISKLRNISLFEELE